MVGADGSDEMLEGHDVVHILLHIFGHLTFKDVLFKHITCLAVAFYEHPKVIALLESGVLLDAVRLVYRRLYGYTALERLDEVGSGKVVQPHADTLDTLVVGQAGEVLVAVDLVALVLFGVMIDGEAHLLMTDCELAIHVYLAG